MDKIQISRRRNKDSINVCLIFGSIFNYNFESFRRFLIYIYYYHCKIDLRRISVDDITDELLVRISDDIINEKLGKKVLYHLTGLSKNTFNDYFDNYLKRNNLIGRRKFSLTEIYNLLSYWQGESKWVRMEAIKKENIAKILNDGNYKKTSDELGRYFGRSKYKGQDKFSPAEIKMFINHIDLTEEDKRVKIIGEEKDDIINLWLFTMLLLPFLGKQIMKKSS